MLQISFVFDTHRTDIGLTIERILTGGQKNFVCGKNIRCKRPVVAAFVSMCPKDVEMLMNMMSDMSYC